MEFVREMGREWRDDRVTGLAAEIAFFGLLSLFPALLAVAAALGSLEAVAGQDVAAQAEEEMVEFFRRVLTDEAAGTIDAVQGLFEGSSPGIATIGLVSALWAASRGFSALVNALDVVYDLDERRGYLRVRVTALGLAVATVVVIALILAMLVLGPLFGTGEEVADWLGFGGGFVTFWTWLRWPVGVVLAVAWAATVLHIAPNHRTPWRLDIPGAVVAAICWVGASFGLRVYLGLAVGTEQVLGTLGGSLIILLWLYLLALGLLLGGEVNAVIAHRTGPRQSPDR